MSAFAETKFDFFRAATQAGWVHATDVSQLWHDSVPPHILTRWLKQLAEVVKIVPADPKRLINHFKLGADPEFIFLRGDGERENAVDLGFQAAMAWGADNNSRLVEIRPAPDRHALAVVTSVWATLHWMARFTPQTLQYSWRSGAYAVGDGLGGHVHFGRKRSTWPREMQALDTLAFWLQHVNIFNQAEWRERIIRTRGHGNYGQLGDRRTQIHGWEYRTIPSWLDSPWLAFAVLTLSKLAVFDPEFLPQLTENSAGESAATVRAKLKGILAYFKGRDDDAALAFQILSRNGWPRFDVSDFKSRWGVFGNPIAERRPEGLLLPTQVFATTELIAEMGQALIENRIPEWTDCPPSWTPSALPKGYMQAIEETVTYRHPGLGELVRDLVVTTHPDRIRFAQAPSSQLQFPSPMVPPPRSKWLAEMKRKFPHITFGSYTPDKSDRKLIYVPGANATDPKARQETIDFLASGWLPVWKASEIQADSLAKFIASQKAEPPAEPKPKRQASVSVWPAAKPVDKPKKVNLFSRPFQVPTQAQAQSAQAPSLPNVQLTPSGTRYQSYDSVVDEQLRIQELSLNRMLLDEEGNT